MAHDSSVGGSTSGGKLSAWQQKVGDEHLLSPNDTVVRERVDARPPLSVGKPKAHS